MAGTLLTTKLTIPPPQQNRIKRPRLLQTLNKGLNRKLTLVSAPAGFGKTTLLGDWVSTCKRPVAWVALDENDNDLARFFAYFISGLETMLQRAKNLPLLELSTQHSLESTAALVQIINQISKIPEDFVFVLDDYHRLESKAIDTTIEFLIEHMPRQMHLVISTREDPQLPLSRLRIRNQMTELRIKDLRFSPEEAHDFFYEVMHLPLSNEEVEALENRTEGWIAGLQLAALSLQGRENTSDFVKTFSGNNRYIVDFLLEEVMQSLPEKIQLFLLQTSILDRLCSSLCQYLTESEETDELLTTIERNNLFIVPLDDNRQWYRYHHLFAEVLKTRLKQLMQEQLEDLHKRASFWFEQNGFRADAIHHALEAKDVRRAAELIELSWPDMDKRYQIATWLKWVRLLPEKIIRDRALLSANYAWALLSRGEMESGKSWLEASEKVLENLSAKVGGGEMANEVAATLATAWAYYYQSQGDVLATETHAHKALDLLGEKNYLQRGIAASLLGVSYYTQGRLELAYQSLADGSKQLIKAGNLLFALRGTYLLADIKRLQGHLNEAINVYKQALATAAEQGLSILRGTADLHLGLTELYLEKDDQSSAKKYLQEAEALGEHAGSPHWQYRLRLAQAHIKEAQGDFEEARVLLEEAEQLYVPTPVPSVYPLAAKKARLNIKLGRQAEASRWAKGCNLLEHDLSFLLEYEHLSLARVFLAEFKLKKTEATWKNLQSLLQRLYRAAKSEGRFGVVIEILNLLCLSHYVKGEAQQALSYLEEALTLAQAEGYIRIFRAEGEEMTKLLSELASRGQMPAYIAMILGTDYEQEQIKGVEPSNVITDELLEPLSKREFEVLELIAEGLSNLAISKQLYRSESTIKGHNRNIFGKLQVQNRTQAVAKARRLGLID